VFAADAKTADKDLFELKQVADGVYAAIAAPRRRPCIGKSRASPSNPFAR
jgi:hypothetical protein